MVVDDVNGANNYSPLPYEIICPQQLECTNLLVPVCVSATHLAFGAIRMEMTYGALGQAAGAAAAQAIDEVVDVQDITYATLRTTLLGSNTLTSEVDPVIPQTD